MNRGFGAMPPAGEEWIIGKSVEEIETLREESQRTGKPVEEILKTVSLEKEYQDTVNMINDQLGIAAAALNTAATLAEKKGSSLRDLDSVIENLSYDNGFDIPDLEIGSFKRAIRNAGWSSSSMSC